jgi:hypothetical protein
METLIFNDLTSGVIGCTSQTIQIKVEKQIIELLKIVKTSKVVLYCGIEVMHSLAKLNTIKQETYGVLTTSVASCRVEFHLDFSTEPKTMYCALGNHLLIKE